MVQARLPRAPEEFPHTRISPVDCRPARCPDIRDSLNPLLPPRRQAGGFLQNGEQNVGTVDAIPLGIPHLLHNFQSFQPSDGPLRGAKSDLQFRRRSFGGGKRIGGQKLDHTEGRVRGISSHRPLPLGQLPVHTGGTTQGVFRHSRHAQQKVFDPIGPGAPFADRPEPLIIGATGGFEESGQIQQGRQEDASLCGVPSILLESTASRFTNSRKSTWGLGRRPPSRARFPIRRSASDRTQISLGVHSILGGSESGTKAAALPS